VNIYELTPLSYDDIREIIEHALKSDEGYGKLKLKLPEKSMELILNACEGDARIALNLLEQAAEFIINEKKDTITPELITEIAKFKGYRFDVKGDEHYDVISAFIKSLRGTDPDAAIYWLARMLEAGEDIRFIMRRMLIFASEDIGNADPFAAMLASAVADSIERVGMPEARILLAQAATYLASAPKSNAAYMAIEKALSDVKHKKILEVPDHLRDFNFEGASKLNRAKGMGKYKYTHDYSNAWVKQDYLPEGRVYYEPKEMGYEKKIKERLDAIKKLKNKND